MAKHKLSRQKTIRYKVIKGKSRNSAIINGNNKYALNYPPGADVYALPETIGVMTFRTHRSAAKWIRKCFPYYIDLIIIKVIPIGRGYVPRDIPSPYKIKLYYKNPGTYFDAWGLWLHPPRNTICYPAVHVLKLK
jgi:hypothetical protein